MQSKEMGHILLDKFEDDCEEDMWALYLLIYLFIYIFCIMRFYMQYGSTSKIMEEFVVPNIRNHNHTYSSYLHF